MSNDINYGAYTDHAERYISHNIGGTTGGLTPMERVKQFHLYLPAGKVLEVGSGEGLDALELQRVGYDVVASDYVDSFLGMLENSDLNPLKLDLKEGEIPQDIQPLDGVFANAVFVHFSRNDFETALRNIHSALKQGGYLYLSVILGEGTEVAGRAKGIEREFFYYQEKDIRDLLQATHYEVDFLKYPIDEKWMHVIAHTV